MLRERLAFPQSLDEAFQSGRADGPWRVWSLGFAAPRQVAVFDYDEGDLEDGHFRVATRFTGLSTGTELTFYRGTNPYLHTYWNEHYRVFEAGEPSMHYPVEFVGYMEVGEVIASRTRRLREGELLAMTYGHKTGHTAHPDWEAFTPLDGLDPVLGVYVAQMGPICLNGLLHAAVDRCGPRVADIGAGVRGQTVLVVGGGVIGLLIAALSRWAGAADVVVADTTPQRRALAKALGAQAVDPNAVDVWRWCKDRWPQGEDDRGADVVFQCRGHADALQTAFASARRQGLVVDLAFYDQGATDLFLGREFHHNGLRHICAQIGHLPRGVEPEWSMSRLRRLTLEFLRDEGRAIRRHLITDLVPLADAARFIEAVADHRHHTVQTVFTGIQGR
jgi:hypothetical protein